MTLRENVRAWYKNGITKGGINEAVIIIWDDQQSREGNGI
jgi:hypothetical protein